MHALRRETKAWPSDQNFASRFGFVPVVSPSYEYSILAISFDGTIPRFSEIALSGTTDEGGVSIYYSPQCPYSNPIIERLETWCTKNNIPLSFHFVDSLEKAKAVLSVFNNWAVFINGEFETVNQIDERMLEKLLRK